MPLFVCSSCGAVDNTALARGGFYRRNGDRSRAKPVCTECQTGEWHHYFEKRQYDPTEGREIGYTPENNWLL